MGLLSPLSPAECQNLDIQGLWRAAALLVDSLARVNPHPCRHARRNHVRRAMASREARLQRTRPVVDVRLSLISLSGCFPPFPHAKGSGCSTRLITCWNDDASRMYVNATRRMTRDMNTKFIEILNQLLKPGAAMHALSTYWLVPLPAFSGFRPRLVKAHLTTQRLDFRNTRNSNTPPKAVLSS